MGLVGIRVPPALALVDAMPEPAQGSAGLQSVVQLTYEVMRARPLSFLDLADECAADVDLLA
ncbi:hypothetical protein LRS74_28060 [Streptomyces sp. LX-29]|uniref:hypothetical protein n=1 Tax=Streptomyces sp. LX-29 TaxID=2900152 RepID=UPI00240CF6C8|nr:hypothetical protein [Streptomyces sp. LX-29]WFB10460.1 hypothetical protein LRS74_28060 [Streptomyces sp. LX-29]